MAQTIWKFPLSTTEGSALQYITVPSGSVILSVAEQQGDIVIYALVVDPKSEFNFMTKHPVWVIGTGHEVPEGVTYDMFLGTVNLDCGKLMFHIFVGD